MVRVVPTDAVRALLGKCLRILGNAGPCDMALKFPDRVFVVRMTGPDTAVSVAEDLGN